MLLLKKLFMALLSLLTLLVCLTASADNGQGERWKWFYSSSRLSFYYDLDTLSYDSTTNVADVRIKEVDLNDNIFKMTHLNFDYTGKTFSLLTTVSYDKGIPRQKNHSPALTSNVGPYIVLETLSNRIADHYHLPHMYKGGPDRWKKIYTRGTSDFYIATDCLVKLSTPGICKFWVKEISGYNKDYTRIFLYMCDFNFKTIISDNSPYRSVIPDTLDEAIYNSAHAIYEQNGN